MKKQNIQEKIAKDKIFLTQGFIGSDPNHFSVILGREGSDYSAAILAFCLDAKSVTIWKDVPGVLNADPRHFDDTTLLQQISYKGDTPCECKGHRRTASVSRNSV